MHFVVSAPTWHVCPPAPDPHLAHRHLSHPHQACLLARHLTRNDPNSQGSSAVILLYGATVSNILQPHFLSLHHRLFPGKPRANSMAVNLKRERLYTSAKASSMDPSLSAAASRSSFPSLGHPPSRSTSNYLSTVSPGIKYGSLIAQWWTTTLPFLCSLHHPPSPSHYTSMAPSQAWVRLSR